MNLRLSVMMFLQYAIWGAWLPILFPYLGGHLKFDGGQCTWIFSAGAAGAIVGPFIAGQVADRHFATEKFLALSHLIGAALVWFLSTVTEFQTFLVVSALYGIIYAPTLALTYSISFHHVADRDRDLGRVRVWGTIGWIAAGIAVGQWLLHRYTPAGAATQAQIESAWNDGRGDAFKLSAVLGLLLGLYCFTLPHTPPKRDAKQRNAVFEALAFVKRQPLLTLFLLAIPMSCVHQFYFVHTANFLSRFQSAEISATGHALAEQFNAILGAGGGGLMTIGQMSEIAVLALMPLLAKQLSRKTLLAMGLVAYAARMALFAYSSSLNPALLGVALHGFCFGCFIFVAFMIVDEETPAEVRASAQNLFNVVIVGIGIVVGSWFSLSVVDRSVKSGLGLPEILETTKLTGEQSSAYYRELFSVPMWISIACLGLLLVFYPARRRAAEVPAEA